jgi:hypothetical protein
VIASINIVVVQAFPFTVNHCENTICFQPWCYARASTSNLRVLLEDFLIVLSTSNLNVPNFLSIHHIGEISHTIEVPRDVDQ